MPPIIVRPLSEGVPFGQIGVDMSDWDRSYVIGSYEYQLTSMFSRKEKEVANWSAEITIIDTLGWDGNKFPIFPKAVNDYLQWAQFGKPGREFSRGHFTVSGQADCCKLRERAHRK
jgi:hypothetical protein